MEFDIEAAKWLKSHASEFEEVPPEQVLLELAYDRTTQAGRHFTAEVAKILQYKCKMLTPPEIKSASLLDCASMDYNRLKGGLKSIELKYRDYWWLKDPGNEDMHAMFVDDTGFRPSYGYSIWIPLAVRPVLNIQDNRVGEVFYFGNCLFKIISPTMAFSLGDIGQMAYDVRSNIYEESEIKEYVDEWLRNARNE